MSVDPESDSERSGEENVPTARPRFAGGERIGLKLQVDLSGNLGNDFAQRRIGGRPDFGQLGEGGMFPGGRDTSGYSKVWRWASTSSVVCHLVDFSRRNISSSSIGGSTRS